MEQVPQLGKLITDGEKRRDAIHIAVAPVTAAHQLKPGERVGLVRKGDAEMVGVFSEDTRRILSLSESIGIVDPFLTKIVEPGERFWLFLFPNTVTSLRHVWTHPAFTAASAARREKLL